MLNSWVDYYLVALSALCFGTVIGDLIVLIRKKVYKTWSTTSIVLSCCMLLLCRGLSLSLLVITQGRDIEDKNLILLRILTFEDTGYWTICITLAMLR